MNDINWIKELDESHQALIDAGWEIERLKRYEKMVQFIANDYYELSYDKVKCQRDDWRKGCQKLIVEDHPEPPIVQSDEELTKDLDF